MFSIRFFFLIVYQRMECGAETHCTEDALTFDEIVQPCISANKSCYNCNTISDIKKQNIVKFESDPYYSITGKSNPSKEDMTNLHLQLEQKCKSMIPLTSHIKKSWIPVEKVNIKVLKTMLRSIRLRHVTLKLTKLFNALLDIAVVAEKWNDNIHTYALEDDWKRTMKDDIQHILSKHKISYIGFSHHPELVPRGLFEYASLLYNCTDDTQSYRSLRKLMDTHGCFEGVFDKATNVMLETTKNTTARDKRAFRRNNREVRNNQE